MRARPQAGFTLLELLIAIGITAMLVSAAVQAYVSLSRAQEQALGRKGRDRAALVLLDRIERELVGTLLIERPEESDRLSHPYVFIGEDRVFGSNDSDALRFITLTPARPPGTQVSGGMRMVTYGFEPRADEGVDMLRQEEPLPDSMDKQISAIDGQLVMDQLAHFRLRYQDDESGEWVRRWDSTDIALLDRLPSAVEVSVQLYQQGEGEELESGPEHKRVVMLPMRPIDLEDIEGEDEDEEDEDEEDDEEDHEEDEEEDDEEDDEDEEEEE